MSTNKKPPTLLYHRVLGGYKWSNEEEIEDCVIDIKQNGLKPKVACEYRNLVPIKIRRLPIVWLGELTKDSPSSIWGCLLEIKTSYLLDGNLYSLGLMDVEWWVYQGKILPEAIVRIENERKT